MSKNVTLKMYKSNEKGMENMGKTANPCGCNTHAHDTFSEINKIPKIKNKGKIVPICNFT